jgi:hypothetical protein
MLKSAIIVGALTATISSAANAQTIPPASQQIAAAVLPLPKELQASATVLGYGANGKLTTLRQGSGPYNCLADDPKGEQFHVACYHKSLEPFMARGRELRATGVKGGEVDTVRFKEIKSGKLPFPKQAAAMYQLTAPRANYDAATANVKGAQPLYVVYITGATTESTGLPTKPEMGSPWIMFPGTPKAHIMLVPKM